MDYKTTTVSIVKELIKSYTPDNKNFSQEAIDTLKKHFKARGKVSSEDDKNNTVPLRQSIGKVRKGVMSMLPTNPEFDFAEAPNLFEQSKRIKDAMDKKALDGNLYGLFSPKSSKNYGKILNDRKNTKNGEHVVHIEVVETMRKMLAMIDSTNYIDQAVVLLYAMGRRQNEIINFDFKPQGDYVMWISELSKQNDLIPVPFIFPTLIHTGLLMPIIERFKQKTISSMPSYNTSLSKKIKELDIGIETAHKLRMIYSTTCDMIYNKMSSKPVKSSIYKMSALGHKGVAVTVDSYESEAIDLDTPELRKKFAKYVIDTNNMLLSREKA